MTQSQIESSSSQLPWQLAFFSDEEITKAEFLSWHRIPRVEHEGNAEEGKLESWKLEDAEWDSHGANIPSQICLNFFKTQNTKCL